MYEASKDNIRCERWMLTGAVSNKRCQRGPAKEVAGACTQQLWVNIYCKWGWFVKWKKGCPWPAQDTWFSPIHLKILLWFWVWIRLTRFMMLLFMSSVVAWHETAHKIFGFAEQAPVLRMPSMTHWFLFWNCNYNSIPLLAGKSAQTDGVCFCENTLHCFDNIGNIGQFLKFGNTMTDRGCSFIGIF